MTRTVAIALAVAAVVYVAYSAGWQSGLKAAPEYAEEKKAQAARDAAFWADLDAEKSPEDRLCEGFIEDLSDILMSDPAPR